MFFYVLKSYVFFLQEERVCLVSGTDCIWIRSPLRGDKYHGRYHGTAGGISSFPGFDDAGPGYPCAGSSSRDVYDCDRAERVRRTIAVLQ